MSNPGQAVLGIVGGVVGFFIGGPAGAAYGFQLGLLAGDADVPTRLPGAPFDRNDACDQFIGQPRYRRNG